MRHGKDKSEALQIWALPRFFPRRLSLGLSSGNVSFAIQNKPLPNDWLRSVLYPAIDETHPRFEDSKYSTKFTIDYIKRLAKEYVDHVEYNSYKHNHARFQ
ncbi:MAG: hypothetical protein OEM28_13415 [Nitrosopumilus sp.]|nr:hypothetical protein [Nitrosopumilus sp.]MDH3488805.1 hypothetical protein [Nitrosopumilus sp.]